MKYKNVKPALIITTSQSSMAAHYKLFIDSFMRQKCYTRAFSAYNRSVWRQQLLVLYSAVPDLRECSIIIIIITLFIPFT